MRRLAALPLLVSAAACAYGFAGGGLPSHIRTVAIVPFENDTPSPELTRELSEALRVGLEQRLGLRPAPEARADAVLRGVISRFELDIPVAVSADRAQAVSARRRLAITCDLELVEQASGRTLWARKGITAEGEYPERGEAQGRRQAIERIVNDVIEGAQSQW